MQDDESAGMPQLSEETRAARGRTLELVGSVVLLSTLLGLAMNLGSTLLLQALGTQQTLYLIGLCIVAALLVLVTLVPRISTAVKEFHEEVELLLPLRVSEQDMEGISLAYYRQLDVFADALRRLPPEERHRLAAQLHASAGKDGEAFHAVTRFALEAAQFLLAVELVKGSRRLLGDGAEFHKAREVARLQTAIVQSEWRQITAQAPGNPLFANTVQGVPEKVLLPGGVRVYLPDIGKQLKEASRRTKTTVAEDVTLLYAEAGRDSLFRITAVVGHSEHGLPTRGAPRRGLTARAVLRNAEDRQLRELARAEEEAAAQLDRKASRDATDEAAAQQEEQHAALYARLYRGTRRPRLLRVFVRFDGAYRIRLLSGERRQRGLYAWGAALSRQLARADVEAFMAMLKDMGQKTPHRSF
jgi:hypothetical protein